MQTAYDSCGFILYFLNPCAPWNPSSFEIERVSLLSFFTGITKSKIRGSDVHESIAPISLFLRSLAARLYFITMSAVWNEHPLCVKLWSSVWAPCSVSLPLSIRLSPLSLSLSLQILQEVIDIFEGVRDDQALRMAANLGFKGPLQRQVMGAPKALKS